MFEALDHWLLTHKKKSLLSVFASHVHAFAQMKGYKNYDLVQLPGDETMWVVVTKEGAVHFLHIDAAGCATGITVVTGEKYWVVFRPKEGRTGEMGNIASIDCFPPKWRPNRLSSDEWEAEAVLLGTGSTL